MTSTNHVPFSQLIGVSPSGVEWVAYKPEHVERMQTRLEALWGRWDSKVVKLTGLTSRQAEWIEMALTTDCALDGESFKMGVTYVEAERSTLHSAADYLEGCDVEGYLDTRATNTDDMNKFEFAVRQAEAGLQNTIKKLRV